MRGSVAGGRLFVIAMIASELGVGEVGAGDVVASVGSGTGADDEDIVTEPVTGATGKNLEMMEERIDMGRSCMLVMFLLLENGRINITAPPKPPSPARLETVR